MKELKPLSKTLTGRLALLRHKKHRDDAGLFVVEGRKSVGDTVGEFPLRYLIVDKGEDVSVWSDRVDKDTEVLAGDEVQMKRISTMATAPDVIAVYERPHYQPDEALILSNLTLLLDGVQDPGNLGTIVRIADWFGVRQVFLSPECADIYSAKAVQATMGSLARVRVFTAVLPELAERYPQVPVCGLLLDGESIYSAAKPMPAFVVMGNEGNGLTPAMRAMCTHRLLIPSYPPGEATGESLNVAMATAITLSEFRRC